MEEMRDDERIRAAFPRDAGVRGEDERAGTDHIGGEDEQEEVRRRAYERYLSRGEAPGDEMDDWLAAEREFRSSREQGASSPGGRSRPSRRGGADGTGNRDGGVE